MRLTTVLIGLALPLAACRPEESVSVSLPDGAQVAMTLQPLISLQSDWSRRIEIAHNGTRVSSPLEEDTGWWRGSGLYLHRSGVYVLHEGQGGCVIFTTSPPAFTRSAAISCEKTSPSPTDLEPHEGFPVSRFYPGLFYIGTFSEPRHDQTGPQFTDHRAGPEPELPESL